jgi:hypothetical protein
MGIYHCDVKPANIFIERDGRVVLGDFGIARLSESATVTFSTPGTPAYMAPEQCRAEEPDARTDVYSLGVTTYEMLTLDRPFKGDTEGATGSRGERVRWEQMNVPPPRPRGVNPDISQVAEAAVLRALEKDAGRRQRGALKFYEELSEQGRVQAADTLSWAAASPRAAPSPVPAPESTATPHAAAKARAGIPRLVWGVLGAMVLAFLAAILSAALMGRGGNDDDADIVATMAAQLTAGARTVVAEENSRPTDTPMPSVATSTLAPTEIWSAESSSSTPSPNTTKTELADTPTPTLVSSPTSTPQPLDTFLDEFDGLGLDTSKWSLDTGSGDALVNGGVLRMASSGRRYPYIYSRYDPFPAEDSFQMSFRFRYSEVKTCGVGVIMTSYLVPVGLTQEQAADRQEEAEKHGVQAGVWQDEASGMQLWFRSGADRVDIPISALNTDWNEMTIRRLGSQYTLYLNGYPAYTSLDTPYHPQGIWIGHPAELDIDCQWSTLEIDYVKIESLPSGPIFPTPTFTPTPVSQGLVVEDAESYGSDATLNATYQINDAWGANEGSLSIAGPPHVGGGTRAIAFWFNIRSSAPDDYSGFERHLPAPQDWSGHPHLCLWVENDGSLEEMVIQFGEKSGEVWKHMAALSTGVQELCLPLSSSTFHIAEWSPSENAQIDLGAINYYGIYVHRAQPGLGTIYIDEIRVVNR